MFCDFVSLLQGPSMKNVFAIICAGVVMVGVAQSQAPPNGQFGLGVAAQGVGGSLALTYAINTNIHIGALLGLLSTSQSGTSQTEFGFVPFFRYLFTTGGVMPYLHAGFNFTSSSTSVSGVSQSQTLTGIFIGGGFAYFWNQRFGVRGEIDVISIGFDPSQTTFALGNPTIGVDWFFGN